MGIGIRQKYVIKLANDKKEIWTNEIIDIFNIPLKKSKKALIELKKLELYGYLKQSKKDKRCFEITKKGKDLWMQK